MAKKLKALQARVDEETAELVEMTAKVQGVSASVVVRKAIEAYLCNAEITDTAIEALEREHLERLAVLDRLRKRQHQFKSETAPAT